jgi:hypothetical protein
MASSSSVAPALPCAAPDLGACCPGVPRGVAGLCAAFAALEGSLLGALAEGCGARLGSSPCDVLPAGPTEGALLEAGVRAGAGPSVLP